MKHEYDLGVLYHGDCREVLRELPDESVDSVVTDPPAGIEFMGKEWDRFEEADENPSGPQTDTWSNRGNVPFDRIPTPRFQGKTKASLQPFQDFLAGVAEELLRVLKPGGHGLVWSIPRTSHHTGMALERAGFEVRDSILHLFGQGFPKSLNIGKAIDKSKGAEREVVGRTRGKGGDNLNQLSRPDGADREDAKGCGAFGTGAKQIDIDIPITAPATPEAAQWEGWGTALKPAVEIWWLVRKPLQESTVAEQVLKTGTGGINVDGSRVAPTGERLGGGGEKRATFEKSEGWSRPWMSDPDHAKAHAEKVTANVEKATETGRWPANVVLSHSPECTKLGTKRIQGITGGTTVVRKNGMTPDDDRTATAAGRFAAKQQPDRKGYSDEDGLETVEDWECVPGCPVMALDGQSGVSKSAIRVGGEGEPLDPSQEGWRFKRAEGGFEDRGGASRFFHNFEPEYDTPFFYTGKITSGERKQDLDEEGLINKHPTVKSIKLMTFLVKLITPPGGTVLDPFAGSGSTLVAAVQNGFRFIGVERDSEYIEIAKGRLGKTVEREVAEQNQRDMFNELLFGD